MTTREKIKRYLNQLSPHIRAREAGVLLEEAASEIDRLHAAIHLTLEGNRHLADGDNSTLIVLKRAVETLDGVGAGEVAA